MSIMFPDKPSIIGRLKLMFKKIWAKIQAKSDERKEVSEKAKELKAEIELEAQKEYDVKYKEEYKRVRIAEAKAKAIKKANEPSLVVSTFKLIGRTMEGLGGKPSKNGRSRTKKPKSFSTLLFGDPRPKKSKEKPFKEVKWL